MNSISIDKTATGYTLAYSLADGQVVHRFDTFDALTSYLVDMGFAPTAPIPTT